MLENLQLFTNVVIYFLNFSGIICLILTAASNYTYVEMFTQTITQWKKGPLDSLIISNNNCTSPFENIINYEFPVIGERCQCQKLNNTEKTLIIKKGKCSQYILTDECRQIYKNELQKFESLFNYSVCLMRRNTSYENYFLENIHKDSCPESFENNCGVIDTKGNILCIKKDEVCPLDFNDFSRNLKFSKPSNKMQLIPIEFYVSHDNICVNKKEFNFVHYLNIDLFEDRRIKNCTNITLTEYHDKRFKKVLSISNNDFFKIYGINSFYKTLKESFPNDFFEEEITLFTSTYHGFDLKCKDKFSMALNLSKILSSIEIKSVIFLIISLMILVYCMLFIMILKELLDNSQYILDMSLLILYLIFMNVIFIMLSQDHRLYINCSHEIRYLLNEKCFDKVNHYILHIVLDTVQSVIQLYVLTMIFYFLMISICFLKILLTCYRYYQTKVMRLVRLNESLWQIELALRI